jgi:hypothetical protein
LEGITRRQYLLLLFFVFVVAWDYFGVVLGICVYELFLRRLEPSGLRQFLPPGPLRTRARRGDDIFGLLRTRSVATIPELRRFSSPFAFFVTPKKDERTDGRTNSFKTTNGERRTGGRIHSKRRTASDGRADEFIQNDERRATNGRMASFAEFRPFGRLFVD